MIRFARLRPPNFFAASSRATISAQYLIVFLISARSARVKVLLPIVYDWFVVQASSASNHASRCLCVSADAIL